MKLQCNFHASSFVKGEWRSDRELIGYDDLTLPLELSGEHAFSYSYPLKVVATFMHVLAPEMTGEDLLVLARADYERIYREEEAAVGNPGRATSMLNRALSPGPYGIWGHDFSDLYFEAIMISLKGMTVSFSMGS